MEDETLAEIQEAVRKRGREMYDLGREHGRNKLLSEQRFERTLKALMGIMEEV